MWTQFRFHFWECQFDPVLSAGFGDSPRLFTRPSSTFSFITYPCPAVLPISDTSISWLWHGDRGLASQLSSSEKSPQSLSALHTSRRFIHRPNQRIKHWMNAFFFQDGLQITPPATLYWDLPLHIVLLLPGAIHVLHPASFKWKNPTLLYLFMSLLGWLRKVSDRRTNVICRNSLLPLIFSILTFDYKCWGFFNLY